MGWMVGILHDGDIHEAACRNILKVGDSMWVRRRVKYFKVECLDNPSDCAGYGLDFALHEGIDITRHRYLVTADAGHWYQFINEHELRRDYEAVDVEGRVVPWDKALGGETASTSIGEEDSGPPTGTD